MTMAKPVTCAAPASAAHTEYRPARDGAVATAEPQVTAELGPAEPASASCRG